MTFIPAPAYSFRVVWELSLRSQLCICTCHVYTDTPLVSGAADANDLFDAFAVSWLNSSAHFNLSEDVMLNRCILQSVTAEDDPSWVSTNSPQSGAASSHALPNEVALVVSEHTGLGGRSHRGRFYLPGIPLSATDGTDLNRID